VTTIVAVAEEFDSRITSDAHGRGTSPGSVLRSMLRERQGSSRQMVEALEKAIHTAARSEVA